MAMTERARNLFRIPEVHSCDERAGYLIRSARELLQDARDYISIHEFQNALTCISGAQRRLRGIPKYLAVRDQLEDAQRIATAGMNKGLR